MKTAEDVLKFWFVDHNKDDWFGGEEAFDRALEEACGDLLPRVAQGEAYTWRATPKGRLAEVIVLDQFSRQLYRGEGRAFAQDPMALVLAQEGVAAGIDAELTSDEKMFFYLPYMHSESALIHTEAVRLYTAMDNEYLLDFENKHFDLIKRFGRYPKRNDALGRQSTPEEIAYINDSGSSFF